MTKRLVEIDDGELDRAKAASGYSTIKDTVSAGLRELAAANARRREIDRHRQGSLASFADDQTLRDKVWH